jgi:hypothetical protein
LQHVDPGVESTLAKKNVDPVIEKILSDQNPVVRQRNHQSVFGFGKLQPQVLFVFL